ncbi:uncharacterized protein LOC126661803 [Mercurialis annua]|uniref:uncharacterized protein LOC126661803 n=1 Tax=Mercurialis annua TaxID=3986 RepID=UPI00215FB087|nr:uncharacterized protein LOC126661803 [Mercurialis annua]
MENENFIDILKDVWSSNVQGCTMFSVVQKLKKLKSRRKDLNLSHYSDISFKVKNHKSLLDSIQSSLQSDPLNENLLLEENAYVIHYKKLIMLEENSLRQKSRINWIDLGDDNNRFFCNSVKIRRCRNRITKLFNADGSVLDSQEAISESMVQFYKNQLGEKAADTTYIGPNIVDFGPKVNEDNSIMLTSAVSPDEVKATMFAIKRGKAPGPDAIIPKNASPNSLNDYRPIPCCNVILKCITKIISSRLSTCVGSIINPSQISFIHGRRIIDNVLLAHELVHDYHCFKGRSSCAMKIDLSKLMTLLSGTF